MLSFMTASKRCKRYSIMYVSNLNRLVHLFFASKAAALLAAPQHTDKSIDGHVRVATPAGNLVRYFHRSVSR